MNGGDALTRSDWAPTAKCEWRASLQIISFIMGITAIRLLEVRLAWQSHNGCLCRANHNTPHLALSTDNIHTDSSVCCMCDETDINTNRLTLRQSGFVCCWLSRVHKVCSDATTCSYACYSLGTYTSLSTRDSEEGSPCFLWGILWGHMKSGGETNHTWT